MNINSKPLLMLSILGTMGSFGYILVTGLNELGPKPVPVAGSMGDQDRSKSSSKSEPKPFNFSLEHDPFANSIATVANNILPNGQISPGQNLPNGGITFPAMPQGNTGGSTQGLNPALPEVVMPGQINDQTITVNGVSDDDLPQAYPVQTPSDFQSPQNPNPGANQMVNSSQSSVLPSGESNPGATNGNAPRTNFPRLVLKGIVEGSEAIAYLEISGSKPKAFSVGSRPLSGVVITGMTSTSVEFTYLGESISLKVGQEVELK